MNPTAIAWFLNKNGSDSQISNNILAGFTGRMLHQRLAPFAARLEYKIPANAQKAAVLILLLSKRDEKYYFPLITRQSNHPEDKHKRASCFTRRTV